MSVTPTGSLSKPFFKLAELISHCPTFISAVSAADQAQALTKIEYPFYDIDKNGWLIPGAVITDGDDAQQSKGRQGEEMGQLFLQFYFVPNPLYKDNQKEDLIDFRNILGSILDEMFTRSRNPVPPLNNSSFMHFIEWEKKGTPTVVGKPEFPIPFRYAEFLIEWN